MRRALAAAIVLASGVVAAGQSDWRQPFDPIRIVGNVYYVGTRGLSSFLIVTPAGGVLIDSGEAASVPFIRANVERLGLRLSDVRLLLAGHAHYDHIGGQAELKRLTGALTVAMDADLEAIESGVDRSALGSQGWTPIKIDRVVKDGETVSLGGMTLTAHLTPGHTQGCTTWTTDVVEDGRRYKVAFVCSVTVNEGVHLVGNARVPAIADHYARTFRVLRDLKPDVFVAEHGSVFDLEGKAEKARTLQKGQPNPFVDPEGYERFVTKAEDAYLTQLRAEKK
ncbi:MAG: subclass B3 metallo-beta-lactamase [Acidobacteria bacterium]|nr:subclass B3 metallo-beta-lactamase [Acidobacteriota bacterium]